MSCLLRVAAEPTFDDHDVEDGVEEDRAAVDELGGSVPGFGDDYDGFSGSEGSDDEEVGVSSFTE